MKKGLSKTTNYLKIGAAAKKLGVSIDTLRRWEKSGKIQTIRSHGGTRLYPQEELNQLSQKGRRPDQPIRSTEELLKSTDILTSEYFDPPNTDPPIHRLTDPPNKIYAKLHILNEICAKIYANPKIFLGTLGTIIIIGTVVAGFISSQLTPGVSRLTPGVVSNDSSDVLSVTTALDFLEINSDTQINGTLDVLNTINGLTIEASPSAGTLTLRSGDTIFTLSDSAELDQDVSISSSPTFSGLTVPTLELSSTSNQLIFQSGGPTGTLTWTPTADRVITIPDATTTLVGIDITQTLTNKTISGANNTITNIPNSALSNSKLTVTAGTNLNGGGEVALGGSITLNLKDSIALAGTLDVVGVTTLRGNVGIGTSVAPSSLTLGVAGNVGIGTSYATLTAPANGLIVEGNVGIGISSPAYQLQTTGNVGIGTSLTVSNIINGLAGLRIVGLSDLTGNVGVGGSLLVNSGVNLLSSLNVGGNSNLSSLTAGSIYANSTISLASGVDILPTGSGSDIGSSAIRMATGWFDTIDATNIAGTLTGGSTTSSSWTINSDNATSDTEDASLAFERGTLTPNAVLGWDSTNKEFDFNSQLHLTGTITSTNGLILDGFANDLLTPAGEHLSLIPGANGNVGIGTTSPGFFFSVSGNTGLGSSLTVTSASILDSLSVTKSGSFASLGVSGNVGIGSSLSSLFAYINALRVDSCSGCSAPDAISGSGQDGAVTFYNNTQTVTHDVSQLFWNNTTNSLGIGTSAPDYTLRVQGTGFFSGFLGIGSSLSVTGNVGLGASLSVSSAAVLDSLQVTKSISGATLGTTGNISVGSSLNVSNIINGANGIRINGFSDLTGNVGIGGTATFNSLIRGVSGLSISGHTELSTLNVSGLTNLAGLTSSGAILAPDGSATSPSYSFSADTNTGIYRVGTDAISLITGGPTGGNLLSLNTTGVGIGTTSPTQKFQVNGNDSRTFVVTSGGNVGIGFTTPTSLLHVQGDGQTGTWRTSGNLPFALSDHTSVVANGYIYVLGGCNGGCDNASTQSTIYYAKLNSDGSTGTWTTNSNYLPAARNIHSSVVANGYVYVLGGCNGPIACTNSNNQSTIYYAKLNSDGSTGTWTTNSNYLPDARSDASSVVANGYVYVMGGCNGACNGGNTLQSTIYYAKLNSDGSTGTWTTNSNYLPQARQFHTSVVANGYVYVMGGCNGATPCNGANNQSTIYYAKLNSDGSTGTWTTNSNYLPDARSDASSVVANGYVYVMGGCNGGCGSGLTLQSTIYYAKLNSDGSTGTWTTNSNYLPQARQVHTSVVANGYVYVLGGCTGALACSNSNNRSTVYFTPLQRVSIQGDLDLLGLSGANLGDSTGDSSFGSVGGSIYAGNIFSAGALEVSGNAQFWNGAGFMGPVNIGIGSSAGVSTVSSTSPLFSISNETSNILRVLAGGNVGIGPSTPDYRLRVDGTGFFSGFLGIGSSLSVSGNAGIGTSLSVTSASILDSLSVTKSISGATLGISGNTGIGSSLSVSSAALLNSLRVNGFSDLVGNIGVGGTATFNSLIRGVSGLSISGHTELNTLNVSGLTNLAGLTSSGAILAPDGSATSPSYSFSADTNTGIYRVGTDAISLITGGPTGANLLSLNSTGVGVGTTSPTQKFQVNGNDSRTFVVTSGGNVGIGFTTPTSLLQVQGDGSTGVWKTNTPNLPGTRGAHAPVTANGYVYVLGGEDISNNEYSTVYYAKINSDGTIGTWTTNGNYLPDARAYQSSVIYNGYVYVIGGQDQSGARRSSVYYAKLNSDGSVGTWQTNSNSLLITNHRHESVVANGYLYMIGGYDGANGRSSVYYAKINADGSIGSWILNSNSLPGGRGEFAASVANGYIYAIGGIDDGTFNPRSSVYYAKINSDGSTAAWATNSISLPGGRESHTAAIANGYIYIIGGYAGAINTAVSTVYYAKLGSGGDLGTWNTSASSLPNIQANQGSIVANGYLYTFGGTNNTIYYAPLQRVSIAGNLDLLGLTGANLGDSTGDSSFGSVGGSIYAGNIFSAGALEVSGNAQFWNGAGFMGPVNIGIGSSAGVSTVSSTSPLFSISNETSNILRVLAGGNVGIGPSTPDYRLRVDGTGFFTGFVGIGSSLSVSGNAGIGASLNVTSIINGLAGLRIAGVSDLVGNVGIGASANINGLTNALGGLNVLGLSNLSGNVGVGNSLTVNGLTYAIGGIRVNGLSDLTGNVGVGGSLNVTSLSRFSSHLVPSVNDSFDLGSDSLRFRDLYTGPGTIHIGTSLSDEYALSYDTSSNYLGFNVNNSGGSEIVFDSSGRIGIGTTSPTQLLQVNYSSSNPFVVTSGGNVGIGFTTPTSLLQVQGDGSTGSWRTNSNYLPGGRYSHSSVAANGYVYVMGGSESQSTVYYAKLNSDGSTGTWTTNNNYLPDSRDDPSSVVANGYIYVMGGCGSTGCGTVHQQSTVYYAKLNSDGSTGTWTTNSNYLPGKRYNFSSVVANGYVYVIGGHNTFSLGGEQSTVYYAKLNSDGSTGTWTTNTNYLPGARSSHTSVIANGYLYVIGGSATSAVTQSTVLYAKLNSDGSVGTWNTSSNYLPTVLTAHTSVVANGHMYTIGAASSSTVYYAKINSDGSIDSWTTNSNYLPGARNSHSSIVANGYIYAVGGYSGGAQSTIYYAPLQRVSIQGNLDLLGLAGANLGDSTGDSSLGSVGGSIYAGNIFSAGALEVSGNSQFWSGAGFMGPVNIGIGASAGVSTVSSTSPLFSISNDTSNILRVLAGGNVGIGPSTPDYRLRVDGTGFFTGFVGIGSSLSISGNVGIGGSLSATAANATAAFTNLNVSGTSVLGTGFAQTLTVSGNVGLGGTSSFSSLIRGLSGISISGHTELNTLTTTGLANLAGLTSTGAFLAPDGSATAPSYSFSADSNTGLYRVGTDAISLIVGGPTGANLLSLNTTGVGVGTTFPIQKLHVEGQCVAVGTKIRRRRRGLSGEWIEEEVNVEDIKPGDEVLSLNEFTGELEYKEVEKLLDKGMQGVFEITTKSGKKIKTTGNHPYLVENVGDRVLAHSSPIPGAGWVKVDNLKVGDKIAIADIDNSDKT